MNENEKEVVWLHGFIKTPPFSEVARRRIGGMIRELQDGNLLSLPHSRPMPEIGPHCHELRIRDQGNAWRIIYRIDPEHVVVAAVFLKKTRETPEVVKASCRSRLRQYDIEKQG